MAWKQTTESLGLSSSLASTDGAGHTKMALVDGLPVVWCSNADTFISAAFFGGFTSLISSSEHESGSSAAISKVTSDPAFAVTTVLAGYAGDAAPSSSIPGVGVTN